MSWALIMSIPTQTTLGFFAKTFGVSAHPRSKDFFGFNKCHKPGGFERPQEEPEPRDRTALGRCHLSPSHRKGLGFIKISVREEPQVVPGEIQAGEGKNSFVEGVGKHWKKLPRAGRLSPSLGELTLGDTWGHSRTLFSAGGGWNSPASEAFPTQTFHDSTVVRWDVPSLAWEHMQGQPCSAGMERGGGQVRVTMAPACGRARTEGTNGTFLGLAPRCVRREQKEC